MCIPCCLPLTGNKKGYGLKKKFYPSISVQETIFSKSCLIKVTIQSLLLHHSFTQSDMLKKAALRISTLCSFLLFGGRDDVRWSSRASKSVFKAYLWQRAPWVSLPCFFFFLEVSVQILLIKMYEACWRDACSSYGLLCLFVSNILWITPFDNNSLSPLCSLSLTDLILCHFSSAGTPPCQVLPSQTCSSKCLLDWHPRTSTASEKRSIPPTDTTSTFTPGACSPRTSLLVWVSRKSTAPHQSLRTSGCKSVWLVLFSTDEMWHWAKLLFTATCHQNCFWWHVP